jgi:hypothetical protein
MTAGGRSASSQRPRGDGWPHTPQLRPRTNDARRPLITQARGNVGGWRQAIVADNTAVHAKEDVPTSPGGGRRLRSDPPSAAP